MMTIFKPVHIAVTKVYAHPVVKPALTHSGIAGFAVEFLHATTEAIAHMAPKALIILPAVVAANEFYQPWRDLVIAFAALALGLVVYCDNAHHVMRVMQGLTGEE